MILISGPSAYREGVFSILKLVLGDKQAGFNSSSIDDIMVICSLGNKIPQYRRAHRSIDPRKSESSVLFEFKSR